MKKAPELQTQNQKFIDNLDDWIQTVGTILEGLEERNIAYLNIMDRLESMLKQYKESNFLANSNLIQIELADIASIDETVSYEKSINVIQQIIAQLETCEEDADETKKITKICFEILEINIEEKEAYDKFIGKIVELLETLEKFKFNNELKIQMARVIKEIEELKNINNSEEIYYLDELEELLAELIEFQIN